MAFLLKGASLHAAITQSFSFSRTDISASVVTLEGNTYHNIAYSGAENGGVPGAPDLPCKYVYVPVPKNATNFSVSYTTGTIQNIYLTYDVSPVMQEIPTDGSSSDELAYIKDSTIYENSNYFPSSVVQIAGEEFRNGDEHYVLIAINPFRYTPLQKKLQLFKSIRVTLNYDENTVANRDLMPVEKYTSDQSFQPFSIIGADSIWNGPAESAFAKARTSEYVIIADSSSLKKPLRRIAALKNQKGYNVGIVTVNEIKELPGVQDGDVIVKNNGTRSVINDDAGKIRAYLREAYKYGSTKYVLLAGDSIPYRKTTKDVPTDWYYCDLNTDWNTIKYDFSPELYVGRIFVSDDKQVKNYSDKLLRYELNPGDGDREYLQKAFYAQTENILEHHEAEIVGEVMNLIIPDTTLMNGDLANYYPKGQDLIQELNRGYGYVSLHFHGSPVSYRLASYNNTSINIRLWAKDSERLLENSIFDQNNHLGLLTNKKHPNVVYSIACESASYDKPHPFEDMTMSVAKAFTSGYSLGGSVAYLGNTRNGYVTSSAKLEREFAKVLDSGITTVGEAEALSRHNYKSSQHLRFTHNLIGDPEFKLWTTAPEEFEGITISRGNNYISISGLPTDDSCYVAYSSDSRHLCVKALGEHTFRSVSPNACIMVYDTNKLPFIAPLAVQNTNISKSQYILASTATFGSHVDSGRTSGDVVVKSGAEYEIEAKGKVILQSGFRVEQGAKFGTFKAEF